VTITPIPRPVEYINPGTTVVAWLPACANPAAPTRAELNAGTDLSPALSDSSGWEVSSDNVESPHMDTTFTASIPGRTKAEDSSLTLTCDVDGDDVRGLLPRGTNGFVVWLDGGDVVDRRMSCFPVRVSSLGMVRDVKGDAPATVVVNFAITSEPQEYITIPA
jgi:hypothetical protein